jgi:hypothetical protein
MIVKRRNGRRLVLPLYGIAKTAPSSGKRQYYRNSKYNRNGNVALNKNFSAEIC